MVHIGHHSRFEVHIDGETTDGVAKGSDAMTVGWSQQGRRYHLQGTRRMGIGDYNISRIIVICRCFHSHRLTLVTDNLYNTLSGKYPSPFLFQRSHQSLSHGIASADDAESTLVVEVHDKGMGGKRCLILFCSIERKVPHQYLSQQRIADDLIEHLIDATQLEGGVQRTVVLRMSQTMEGGGVRHLFHEGKITMQVLAFLGERLCHLFDERLLAVGKTELLTLKGYHIIACGV